MLTQDELKTQVGQAALAYVVPGEIVGVGTGSTVNKFIDALATMRRSSVHLARVVDADGETTGVLFLEDIIEELVGEVQDATRRA